MRERGFTVVELLVAVVIIGILAALVFARFGESKEKTYIAAEKNDLRVFATQAELALDKTGAYPTSPTANSDFHYSDRVSTFGYLRTTESWHLLVQHAQSYTVCGLTQGPNRSSRIGCANGGTLIFTGGASGNSLTLDASGGLALASAQAEVPRSIGTSFGATPVGPVLAASIIPTFAAAPTAVPITAADVARIAFVDWDFGDGQSASAEGALGLKTQHTYAQSPDGFDIHLAVTFTDGSLALGAGHVAGGTVSPTTWGSGSLPAGTNTDSAVTPASGIAVAFSWAPTPATVQSAVQFTDGSTSAASPIASRLWTFADGTTATGATPTHTFTTAGDQAVTLAITSQAGGHATLSKTVRVTVAPVAAFTWSPAIALANQALTVDASSSSDLGGHIVSYAWDFGDFATGADVTTTHAFASEGPQTVQLTVTDDNGVSASTTRTVPVDHTPIAQFVVSPAIPIVGQSASFNASTSSDADHDTLTYQWTFGDSGSATGVVVSHTFMDGAPHTVTLTVTDEYAAVGSLSQSVTATGKPHGSFTWTPSAPAAGDVITLTAAASTTTGTSTITGYAWRYPDGSTATGVTPPPTSFATAGTYSVRLIVTSSVNVADTVTHNIVVTAPVPHGIASATAVSAGAGDYLACEIDNGTTYCQGFGTYGVGDGTASTRTTATAVNTTVHFTSVVAGGDHQCALTSTGAAYCWGWNALGQVGNGSTATPVLSPVAVSTSVTFTKLALHNATSCGISTDTKIYCWGGDGSYGATGSGGLGNTSTPRAISGGYSYTDISGANGAFCAIRTDGKIYCWGNNQGGVFGNGNTASSSSPTVISSGITTWSKVAVGFGGACAITTAGDTYCWGQYNTNGVLGDGTTTARLTPARVAAGTPALTQIAAGDDGVCGLDAGGHLWCWGAALLSGTGTRSLVPTQITTSQTFTRVSVGEGSTLALATDGTVWGWGYNFDGQLSDGTTTQASTPVQMVRY